MPSALEGLRVVDLTVGLAGPVAGMMLADSGADVIKVEPPGGDPTRGRPGFQMWNRSKRAVTCDLADPGDRDQLGRLLEAADVILVGTVPPALTRDDLAGHGMTATEGAWIVLPPFVSGHTPWAGGQESAGLLFAGLGHAWNQSSYDDVPVDCVYPLALYMQGLWAAAVAVAAVTGRSSGGLTYEIGGAHGASLASPGGFSARRDDPHPRRAGGPGGTLPNYRCYRCADGQWLFLGAYTAAFITRAFQGIGASHVMDDDRVGNDPNRIRSPDNFGWVTAEVTRIFATHPREHWLGVLERADVPVAAVLETEHWLEHIQVESLGLRTELRNADGHRVVMPGVPVRFSGTPGAVRAAAPTAGARIAGFDAGWLPRGAVPGGEEDRRPLDGIRVLDLGTIIAGPYIGTLLSELGADVIKIERPPAGDEFRTAHGGRGGAGFPVYNRSQRSLAIDLASPAGGEAFRRLVRSVDVVVDNYRPGVLPRLGLDRATLAADHEGLITASVSAFGGAGPLGSRPGFDPVVQAMSGIMRSQGGPDEADSPVFLTVPINDVLAAVLATFGVCASLYHRQHGGAGQEVSVPLVAASCLLQSENLVRVDGAQLLVVGGRDFAGPTPLNCLYRAADGWVRVDGSWPTDVAALRRSGLLGASGTPATPGPPTHEANGASGGDGEGDRDRVTASLTESISRRGATEVVAGLTAAGIPAIRAIVPSELTDQQVLIDSEVLRVTERQGDQVTEVFPGHWYASPGSTRLAARPAPTFGQDSAQVLSEAGLTAGEIDSLLAAGVIIDGSPQRVPSQST